MTYYVYDVNGYVGDAASVGGFGDFARWARKQGGLLRELADKGYVNDVKGLAKELASTKSMNESAEWVRANLARLAKKTNGVFIISDGVVSDDG